MYEAPINFLSYYSKYKHCWLSTDSKIQLNFIELFFQHQAVQILFKMQVHTGTQKSIALKMGRIMAECNWSKFQS